jgi:hypothetical protein
LGLPPRLPGLIAQTSPDEHGQVSDFFGQSDGNLGAVVLLLKGDVFRQSHQIGKGFERGDLIKMLA